jgi:hypothetical protein
MDQDSLGPVVIGLAKVIREQHLQIEKMRKTLDAVQQTLDSAAQSQIDEVLRPWRRTSDEPIPFADETLELIDRLLQQLAR